MESLTNLLNGDHLDAEIARARHRNGAPGFYMAEQRGDAEYFAVRREGGGNVVTIEVEDEVLEELIRLGARLQPIPTTPRSPRFESAELFIPEELFPAFNSARALGRIHVSF